MPRLIRGSTNGASNPRRRAPCGFGIGRERGAAFYSEACARSHGGTRIHILYGYIPIRMAPAESLVRLEGSPDPASGRLPDAFAPFAQSCSRTVFIAKS